MLTIVVATEQKPFKHEKNILAVLNEYMSSVDNKDIDAMLNHLTIPIDLHFGSGRVGTVRSGDELKNIFQNLNLVIQEMFKVLKKYHYLMAELFLI